MEHLTDSKYQAAIHAGKPLRGKKGTKVTQVKVHDTSNLLAPANLLNPLRPGAATILPNIKNRERKACSFIYGIVTDNVAGTSFKMTYEP